MKIFKYFIIVILITIIISFIGLKIYNTYINVNPGMRVTLLGGSNQADKGNIRSMGYIIRTRFDEVIFIYLPFT